MKKTLLIVLALSVLGVGVAFARGGQPPVTGMMVQSGYGARLRGAGAGRETWAHRKAGGRGTGRGHTDVPDRAG